MAGLFKYFQRHRPRRPRGGSQEAKTAVRESFGGGAKWSGRSKRKYKHFTPAQRAKIGKYAAQYANTASVRHLSKEFSTLGESTVRLSRKGCEAELQRKGLEHEISHLPQKK